MRTITVCLISIALASCAVRTMFAPPPPYYSPVDKANKDESVLYIYTVEFTNQALRTPGIFIDGIPKTDIGRGVYVWEKLTPGQHYVTVKNDYGYKTDELTINVAKGEDIYIKVGFGEIEYEFTGVAAAPIVGDSRPYLSIMDVGTAKAEISKTRLDSHQAEIINKQRKEKETGSI